MFGNLVPPPPLTMEDYMWDQGKSAACRGITPLTKDAFDQETVFDYYFYYCLGYREIVQLGFK